MSLCHITRSLFSSEWNWDPPVLCSKINISWGGGCNYVFVNVHICYFLCFCYEFLMLIQFLESLTRVRFDMRLCFWFRVLINFMFRFSAFWFFLEFHVRLPLIKFGKPNLQMAEFKKDSSRSGYRDPEPQRAMFGNHSFFQLLLLLRFFAAFC